MITIVNYGAGNIGSLLKMFAKIGASATASNDPEIIRRADKLVLPGVGHFGAAMTNLRTMGMVEALNAAVLSRGVPILGVCLGMQLLARHSEEGDAEGLNWIDAEVRRFHFPNLQPPPKIPNMGWRTLELRRPSTLIPTADEPQRFYFVHSYHMECRNPENVLAVAHYGIDFVSVVQSGLIYGAQFHPEKSHRYGARLLENFAHHC